MGSTPCSSEMTSQNLAPISVCIVFYVSEIGVGVRVGGKEGGREREFEDPSSKRYKRVCH